MRLDAGTHAGQVGEQARIVEMVTIARHDGRGRCTVRYESLQRIQLAQGRSQVLALSRHISMNCGRHGQDRSEQERHAAVRGATPNREHHRSIPSLDRSEEQTSELQSLMRISYAVSC